jgi:hypothetical protein
VPLLSSDLNRSGSSPLKQIPVGAVIGETKFSLLSAENRYTIPQFIKP